MRQSGAAVGATGLPAYLNGMTTRDTDVDDQTTVYFDGSCALCSLEINHYKSRRGAERLRFVDVSDENAVMGEDLTREDAMKRFHVRRPDGSLASGARGFAAIWDKLPNWRWLGRIGRVPGVMSLLEVAYQIFLPLRPYLSRAVRALGARPGNPKPDK